MLNSPKEPSSFALVLTFMTTQQEYCEISMFLERMKSDKDLYEDWNLEVIVG